MARHETFPLVAAFGVAMGLGWAGMAHACDGAGVIVRIDGQPQDVLITRTEAGAPGVVSRPRVLEVVCQNDVIKAVGATSIVLSIDGAGTVRVDHGAVYRVPARSGAPTVIGNAYRSINEQVMPDMKRMPWNVRLKGAGDDFGFALPSLEEGGQQVRVGSRSLLVRLVGGTAPYKVEIRDAQGRVIAARTSSDHEVALGNVSLSPGAYKITASDSSPRSLDATVTAVDAAPPAEAEFAGLNDQEIRAAAAASELARTAPGAWSFEAEQELAAAPANGLDRDKVYELIESYSAQ
jgi:hypothetical protein